MSKVIADITMSLDGYVTGPDPDLEHGLGRGDEPLHAWVESDHEVDREVLREIAEAPGAVVIGQAIEQGLVDELHLHPAPMLLGGGTPPFPAGTRQGIANVTSALRATPSTSPTSG